ncbi:hypothetical protein H257_15766 [Aphanomyces astaci]|uniref:Uncharacterized protein n=1 Tax=Aphanomyces astaci TaxID=112090 RepID=W4FL28_APHAT|nr:hypothetical protein H257_15766 [Aphanomyces astaci]ETV68185.1 hypothetical protein H257_15766 [Aphanomyces astaci]|eukprot:XP_009842270.1 hypothetical protein H257_15766 [Aphanomyces astaci]
MVGSPWSTRRTFDFTRSIHHHHVSKCSSYRPVRPQLDRYRPRQVPQLPKGVPHPSQCLRFHILLTRLPKQRHVHGNCPRAREECDAHHRLCGRLLNGPSLNGPSLVAGVEYAMACISSTTLPRDMSRSLGPQEVTRMRIVLASSMSTAMAHAT